MLLFFFFFLAVLATRLRWPLVRSERLVVGAVWVWAVTDGPKQERLFRASVQRKLPTCYFSSRLDDMSRGGSVAPWVARGSLRGFFFPHFFSPF